MDALRGFVDATQQNVTGEARVRLYKGGVQVTGRRSPVSLYDENLSSFEDDAGAYDQGDATGFIRITGLRLGR
jgi:argininosuccinate synthase